MGLFDRLKDPVEGSAEVVAITGVAPGATGQACDITLVVQAPGMAPYSTVHHERSAPVDRYPQPGAILPVVVDRAHPDKLRIAWDRVPRARDQARALADALAAQLRSQAAAPGGAPTAVSPAPSGIPQVNSMVGQLQAMFPGATIKVNTRVVSRTPGQPGLVRPPTDVAAPPSLALVPPPPAAAPPVVAPPAPAPPLVAPAASPMQEVDERLASLERLAALHAQGALTDEEFAAEKVRVLGA